MSEKLRVGILGGTGMVGQRFISLLENHPWFEVVTIAASARSAGKTYEEAVGGRWKMDTPMPEAVKKIIVMNVNEVEKVAASVDFVFSAVDMSKDEIKAIEEAYAKTETPVVSNNSAHRWTPDVPMVVPEINPEHFEVIEHQKKRLGTTRGFIAVKPNCSIQSYAPVLTAWKEFEPYEVVATTYQAISGAGKTFKDWPEMVGNIIPYIGGEEEKSEQEPLRIWGHIEDGVIVKAEEPKITCQCIRVPVLNGHTAAVFVKFRKKPTKEQLIDRLVNFKGFPQEAGLPSAPKQFIRYMEEDNRPQVQLDVNYENGMGISVGQFTTAELPRVQLVAKMMGKDFDDLAAIKNSKSEEKHGEEDIVIKAVGLGKKGYIKPFDLVIHKGEVVGFTGLLGSGRSETVRVLYGAEKPDEGELSVKGRPIAARHPLTSMNAGMAYLPEDRKNEGIIADLSVRENLIMALQAKRGMFHLLSRKQQEEFTDKYIDMLQIKTASRETPIKSLSGGNQQKVIIGRWLLTNPDFLILDEPTRGIDVGTKTEIQKLVVKLAEQGMAVVFISSEIEEMLRTCDRMVVMRDGAKVGELSEDEMNQSNIMSTIAGGQ